MAPCLVDRLVNGLLTCIPVRRRMRLATRLLKLTTEAIRRTSHGRHPARHKPSVAVYCIRFRMIRIWHPFEAPSARSRSTLDYNLSRRPKEMPTTRMKPLYA